MQVVLLKRVPKLGDEHDVVSVKPGYARNFLLPKKFALLATKDQISRAEKLRAERVEKADAKLGDANSTIKAIKALELTFKKKARSDAADAKLYGSVAEKDIVKALKEHNIVIDEKNVVMEHIKTVGDHKIKIHLSDGVEGSLKVKVEKE